MKAPWASSLAVVLGLATSAEAQETPQVFPSIRDVVAVDVSVVDDRGRPVRDLAPEDFVVTLDGKPRKLLSAQFLDVAGEDAPEPAPPSPYFSTNADSRPGRLVLMVVDQNSLAPGSGRALLASADRLLDRLGSRDRVGLAAIPAPGPTVEFTADLGPIREALGRVTGRARRLGNRVGLTEALDFDENRLAEWDSVVNRVCGEISDPLQREECLRSLEAEAHQVATDFRQRSWASLKALGTLFDGLGAIEGPKTVVYVTEGLAGDEAAAIRDLAARASAARASVYVIQVDTGHVIDAAQGIFAPSEGESQGFLANGILDLARMSRGGVFRVTGSGEAVFDRIALELSGYYLLGFAPEIEEQDGRNHAVRVTVPGRKLTVRSRTTVNLPAPGAARSDESVLGATLRGPFLATDLPVRVATYSLPEKDPRKGRVLVSARIDGVRESLTVAYVLVDGKGRAAATGGTRFKEVPGGPVQFTGASVVDFGRYTLKLAAVDRAGRRGSVERGLDVRLATADGIRWGDLVVAAPPASGHALQPSIDLDAEGSVVGRLEIQAPEGSPLDKVAVALEIAETPEGPAILRVPTTTVGAPESGRKVAQAVVASSLLPPGDYVLRAAVSLAGSPIGSAGRPFRLARAGLAAQSSQGLVLGDVAAVVGSFDPASMLRADVIGHFLDRVSAVVPGPLPPAARAAADHARRGEAQRILADLAQAQIDDPRIDFLRGLGLFAGGQWGGAATQLRRAIALASELMPATVYLGACFAAQGRDVEAAGAWQTALVSETSSPVVYAQLADALLRAREADRATVFLKEALASWPADGDLLRRLGMAHAMTGERAEALRLLSSRVEQHPEDLGALFVTLRLLLDSLAAAPARDPAEREHFSRYAKAYVSARGPNYEVVSQWLKYLDREH